MFSSMLSGGSRISQAGAWGDANSWLWGKNQLFGKIYAENCMKIKENGPRGRIPSGPSLLWIRQWVKVVFLVH